MREDLRECESCGHYGQAHGSKTPVIQKGTNPRPIAACVATVNVFGPGLTVWYHYPCPCEFFQP